MNCVTKFSRLSPLWRPLCSVCGTRNSLPTTMSISPSVNQYIASRCVNTSTTMSVRRIITERATYGEELHAIEQNSSKGQNQRNQHRSSSAPRPTTMTSSTKDANVAETDVDMHSAVTAEWSDSLAERPLAADEVRSHFPISFNLAAYVDSSETLQQLIKLGVDLSRLERVKDLASWLIKLDYESDIAPHVRFLHEAGVPVDQLGYFITWNPRIFDVPIEDLQVRINYLESKKFDRESIARILTKAPQFIQNSTKEIDRRLGFFQKEFQLSGDEVRYLTASVPKIILANLTVLLERRFALVEQMGFSSSEIKDLLLKKPKIWVLSHSALLERFDYIHNELGFAHASILEFPGGLTHRKYRVRQRHLFLKALDRAQYDPTAPLYVSLRDLTTGTDSDFCDNVAKSSVQKYNDFLMTL